MISGVNKCGCSGSSNRKTSNYPFVEVVSLTIASGLGSTE